MKYFIFFNLKTGWWDYIGVEVEDLIPSSIPLKDVFETSDECIKEMIARDKGIKHNDFYHYVYQGTSGTWMTDETYSLEAESVKRIPKDKIYILGKGDFYLMEARSKCFSFNYHNYKSIDDLELIEEALIKR